MAHPRHFERSLLVSLMLTLSFLFIEVIGAYLSHSLALLSDAAHMLVDSTALFISFIATKLSRRPPDLKKTFGYYRFEILAATVNALMLFITGLFILYKAYQRIGNQIEISSPLMFSISFAGLIINFIALKTLSTHHHETNNLNFKSAYLEVLSDFVSSLAVMIGASIIYLTNIHWIDSLIALGIAAWIMPRTWHIFQNSMDILMESVPENIDIEKLMNAILMLPHIISIHDLHVWSISSDKLILSAHIVIDKEKNYESTQLALKQTLANDFNIHHSTIQIEQEQTCTPKA
jgi:cobalt-zinc-cadmium efflux system protein